MRESHKQELNLHSSSYRLDALPVCYCGLLRGVRFSGVKVLTPGSCPYALRAVLSRTL